MGIVQLNQIKRRILDGYEDLIDVSDVKGDVDEARLSRGLVAWVVSQVTGVPSDIAAQSVTDGYDDNGIDAIYTDVDQNVVYLVQGKWNRKGTGSPALGDVHKFIQGFRDLVNAEWSRFNDKVRAKQAELEAALSDPAIRFSLVFAHSGTEPLSEHARNAIDGLLAEVNDPIDTADFEMLSQAKLHDFLGRNLLGASPDLEATLYDWGAMQEPFAAYYGQVEANQVAEWYNKHGLRLFAKNIRQFLGKDSEVNSSILETLKTRPQHFWYLNNGVTVLCQRVAKSALGGSSKKVGHFEFSGVSVVNGAQTVGCIGEAAETHPDSVADARVTIRFISLENCPPDFANEVTRGTNTQNRVERRDFVALDPEQSRLVMELAIDGVHYAIKSGEESPQPEAGFTVIEATVAQACAQPTPDLAVQAKREIGRLWLGAEESTPGSQYRRLFNSHVSGMQVWRGVRVLREIDNALVLERTKRQGRERLIGVHGNRLIAHVVFQRLNKGALTDPAHDFEAELKGIRGLVATVYASLISVINAEFSSNYLASLFKNASRCRQLTSML